MDPEPHPPHRPGRRFRIALAVSLALNLLFVGIFAGAAWRQGGGHGGRDGSGPGVQGYAAAYVHALPRADRRALRAAIRAAHPGEGRAARRAAYAQMLAALRAEAFDAGAIQAVLDRQRRNALDVQMAAQAHWMEILTRMDAGERAAYADRLEERLQRGPRRKDRDRRGQE